MLDRKFFSRLGPGGKIVSPIGLGTVKFGRNTDVRYPHQFSIPDDKSLASLLSLSRDLGINLIDTAPAYGNSEERLGALLKGSGDYWCISTKVGEYYRDGLSHYDYSAKTTRKSIENSLRNLHTEVLDLVLVHSDGNDEHIIQQSDVLQVLNKFKGEGLIRSVGFSGKTVAGSLLAMDMIDVFMIALSEQNKDQAELISAARQNRKGILIKKALESGHSTDTKTALEFAINFPGVSSVIVGTINPDHLRQNVRAAVTSLASRVTSER